MSDNSAIQWTDATWNPVRGCDKVSAGCKNCYAETFSERWRGVKGHPFEQGFDLRLVPESLGKPLGWKKSRRIFVNSMSDLFHEDVPSEYIAAVFGVMAACPQHSFQVLTKRPGRMVEWFRWVERRADDGLAIFPNDTLSWRVHQMLNSSARKLTQIRSHHDGLWPLWNVHLGVSCENQETADERIPLLLQCPARINFVSAEPLLGPIEIPQLDELDWVIAGGESGPGARTCDVAWIRSIVKQCKTVGAYVFVKQLGARVGEGDALVQSFRIKSRKGDDMAEWPEDLRVREFPVELPR